MLSAAPNAWHTARQIMHAHTVKLLRLVPVHRETLRDSQTDTDRHRHRQTRTHGHTEIDTDKDNRLTVRQTTIQ